jgi:deoxyribodipyrimidine photo-lyase
MTSKSTDHDETPEALRTIAANPRIQVRRGGAPAPDGKCVVYWMQRAERALDNPALDVAVEVADALDLPVLVYFSAISNFPHANLRHYVFLNQGLADIEEDLQQRQIGFIVYSPK